jgi:hypothetical protein
MSKPHIALNWAGIAVESVVLAGNPRSPFGLSETLGVAMRNHVILFDDTFGRSVIVWSAGLLQWSFSIDGRPAGRAWLTRGQAYRAARKAAGTMPASGGEETVSARRLKVYCI